MVKIESPMFTSDNDLKSPATSVTYSVPLKHAAEPRMLAIVEEEDPDVPPVNICVVAVETVTG